MLSLQWPLLVRTKKRWREGKWEGLVLPEPTLSPSGNSEAWCIQTTGCTQVIDVSAAVSETRMPGSGSQSQSGLVTAFSLLACVYLSISPRDCCF